MVQVNLKSDVTGEQVKQAVEVMGFREINHHDCSLCGYPVRYLVDGETNLFFDRGCGCVRNPSPPEFIGWDDPAEWINMQGDMKARRTLMERFGFEVVESG